MAKKILQFKTICTCNKIFKAETQMDIITLEYYSAGFNIKKGALIYCI